MARLSLDFQVPDKYDKQTIAGIIRQICTQVNQVSEGGISGRYQAQSVIPTGSAVSYATGDMVWDANVTVTSGRLGWVCTVPGSPGTLMEFGGLMTTPAVDTNNSQFATTAFVLGQGGNGTPLADGTAVSGISTRFSRQDHVHPTLAGNATPLANGTAVAGTSASFARQDHVHPLTTTGTLTAGTSAVLNPAALSTKTAQAHGLSKTPDFYHTYIECLSAELGYSVGDRVGNADLNGATGWMVEFDATNITTITSNTNIAVINKTTPAGTTAITLSKWKLVAVPYTLS